MDYERLIADGLAGRLEPGTPEFERFVDITARRPSGGAGAPRRSPRARRRRRSPSGRFVLVTARGFAEATVEEGDEGPQVAVARA